MTFSTQPVRGVNSEKNNSTGYEYNAVDSNNNKIEDVLESSLSTNEFLIKLNGDVSFSSYGFTVKYRNSDGSIAWIKGNPRNLAFLADLFEVQYIEGVKDIKPHLAYSSKQIGLNPYVWNLGYSGSPAISVAVLDTGIDASHPAFANKQVTWVDFAGVSISNSGDEYQTPVDKDGHGTHVAGIVAGSPVEDPKEGFTGIIPSFSSFQIIKTVRNLETNLEINYTIDWADPGEDNPGNKITVIATPSDNIGNVVAASETDTSGFFKGTLTVAPGEYIIGVANQETTGPDPQGLPYSISTTIITDSEAPQTPYKSWRGIAPDVSLVAIKVFDDSGNGNTGVLLEGLDWVKNNYDTYNISVVNLSLGTDSISSLVDSEVENLSNLGILVVTSAGNNGVNSGGIGSPGSAPYALTVGAVNKVNEVAYYSSNGDPGVNTIKKPDVLAPGGSAAIPGLGDTSAYSPGNGLIISAMSSETSILSDIQLTGKQGTSMAAPHVSGVASILYQILKERGELTGTLQDVKRVKNVLELSAFEVGNIFNGGEQIQGGVKQNPQVDPATKDYVEGWGMINPIAAVKLLTEPFSENSPISLEMGLENPFIQNSLAREITLNAGSTYRFWATIPKGSQIDFILYDHNPGQYGDPVPLVHRFLDATTQNSVLDVPVLINQTARYGLSLKLRDSINDVDQIHFVVLNNFVPFITPVYPEPNGYVNQSDINLKFQSMTNLVYASIDGNTLGQISSGFLVQGLSEGKHDLSLEERNEISGLKANSTFSFNVDTVVPSLTANLTSITTNEPFTIEYTALDNVGIELVQARANSIVFDTSTSQSGFLVIDPSKIQPGTYDLVIEAFDLANNVFRISTAVTFVHDLFIEGENRIEAEFNRTVSVEWTAGSQNPDRYKIYVDGNLVVEKAWDGSSIRYNLSPIDLGDYNLTVEVSNNEGKVASFTTILSLKDTTPPTIRIDLGQTFDATFSQEVAFGVEEFFPFSLQIKYNGSTILFLRPWNGSFFFSPILISGKPGSVATIDIGIVDTSGNIANETRTIFWMDLTAPVINPLENQKLKVGQVKELEWNWEERFVKKIKLMKNGESIFESTDQLSSIKFSIGEATPQTVDYVLEIEDLGNHTVQSHFLVEVVQDGSSEQSGQAFIPLQVLPLFSAYVIILKKKTRV